MLSNQFQFARRTTWTLRLILKLTFSLEVTSLGSFIQMTLSEPVISGCRQQWVPKWQRRKGIDVFKRWRTLISNWCRQSLLSPFRQVCLAEGHQPNPWRLRAECHTWNQAEEPSVYRASAWWATRRTSSLRDQSMYSATDWYSRVVKARKWWLWWRAGNYYSSNTDVIKRLNNLCVGRQMDHVQHIVLYRSLTVSANIPHLPL